MKRSLILFAVFLISIFSFSIDFVQADIDASDIGDGTNASVYVIAPQPDGSIVVGGAFTEYKNDEHKYIVRQRNDGSLDTSFDPEPNGPVHAIAIQLDGSILIGGEFTNIDGHGARRFARLLSNGFVDDDFNVGRNPNATVKSIFIQSDGKILIAGEFDLYNNQGAKRVARLNSDGSLDNSFNTSNGASGVVNSVAQQINGQVIIAGDFNSYGGKSAQGVARLNSDGSLDTSFDSGFGPNSVIEDIVLQSDGTVIIIGDDDFTSYDGNPVFNRIAKVNSDGSLDVSFSSNPDDTGVEDFADIFDVATSTIVVDKGIDYAAIEELIRILSSAQETVRDIIETPIGDVTAKAITTAGVVAGGASFLSVFAFANPITLTEIWLLPLRLFSLMLAAFGIKKKSRPWGTVYDSVTKRPLDPAYVILTNVVTGEEVASAITDLDGRYGFLVGPGRYRITANKTNYSSPSKKMAGKFFDEMYHNLYFGDEILVINEGETITKNIPMDPDNFDWNEFAKNKTELTTFVKRKDLLWAKISKFVFWIGLTISLIVLVTVPAPYNYIIIGLYAVIYALSFFGLKTKKTGTLLDPETGDPLSFAIIRVFREGEEKEIAKKVADQYGKYYCIVPNGTYFIRVDKKNDDQTYTRAHQSQVMKIEKGIINIDLG